MADNEALEKKKNDKPTPIRKRKEINIGLIVFIFVAIYFSINIYFPFLKNEIAIFEVQKGYIYSTSSYNGIIIREEELVFSEKSGYISHYYTEGERVAKEDDICGILEDRSVYDKIEADGNSIKLSSNEMSYLKKEIQEDFQKVSGFSEYSSISNELVTEYNRLLDHKLKTNINSIISKTGVYTDFNIVKGPVSGIVSYIYDGFTSLSSDLVTSQMYTDEYHYKDLYFTDSVNKGDPLFKLIKSDDWQIVVSLDESIYQKLSANTSVDFYINGSQKLTAPCSFIHKDDLYLIVISMEHFISTYSSQRFLDISFDTEETIGLKVPVSALTYKDYYRIPKTFFTVPKDNDDKTRLILARYASGSDKVSYYYIEPDIFWEEPDFYYISSDLISSEESIVSPDYSQTSMLYLFTIKLEGAYNINKGYAMFKRVERLQDTGDYVLIKRNSESGLSEFDHIALNAANVVEGDVIY